MGAIVSNIQKFQKELEKADKARVSAASTAVKVEGFRLRNLLKEEIRKGAPGGRPFSPLSVIAQARKYRQKNKSPLSRLAVPIRYRANYDSKGGMTFEVGFVNPTRGAKLSKSWIRLAQLHQQGGKLPVTDDMRKGLITIGQGMKGKKKNVFFLKKTTTEIRIPARPIIDPFWDAHERQAEQNIIANFARKMRGERI